MCWHLSPLSLIHPGLGRGWDNQTLSPTTCPAQPCCSSGGRRCLYSPQPVSPSAHQHSRHTKRGVISLGFGHSSLLLSFPGQLGRPQLLFTACCDRECLSPQCHYCSINFNVSTSLSEINAKQQDERFIDTSMICFQEYMQIAWIPSDRLPGAGCLYSDDCRSCSGKPRHSQHPPVFASKY